jgi:hypothetical protein
MILRDCGAAGRDRTVSTAVYGENRGASHLDVRQPDNGPWLAVRQATASNGLAGK